MCRFRCLMCLCTLASLLLSCCLVARTAGAQERRERTLDEVKAEALRRAEDGMYPLIGLDPADVREAFASVTRMDDDEWAAAFMKVAGRYMAQGKALATAIGFRFSSDSFLLFSSCNPGGHAGQPARSL